MLIRFDIPLPREKVKIIGAIQRIVLKNQSKWLATLIGFFIIFQSFFHSEEKRNGEKIKFFKEFWKINIPWRRLSKLIKVAGYFEQINQSGWLLWANGFQTKPFVSFLNLLYFSKFFSTNLLNKYLEKPIWKIGNK